ncbi:MAG: hypothetical protein ABL995_05660 [Bryobacteraceae bacterium]
MSLVQVISALNLAASFLLLARMVASKLFRIYPLLTAFISVDAIFSVCMAATPIRSNFYSYLYMVGTTVGLLLSIGVVMEIFSGALAEHPALAKFGSRVVGYVLIAAGFIAAGTLQLDEGIPKGQSVILHRFFRAERTVDFGEVLFLVGIGLFLIWFPVRVKKNIAYVLGGFGVYYMARSAGLLVINLLPPGYQRAVDNSMLGISFLCILAMAWLLRAELGQPVQVVRRDSAAAEHLTSQLREFNSAVARLGRRHI